MIFGDLDRLPSNDLAARLSNLDEAPWGDLYGKPIDARGLAGRLRKYDIRPKNVRLNDGSQVKGYERAEFVDAWMRYVPSSPELPSHPSQPSHDEPPLTDEDYDRMFSDGEVA